MHKRLLTVPAAALGAALLLTGCGSSSTPGAGSTPGHSMSPGMIMPTTAPSTAPSSMTPMPEMSGAATSSAGAHNAADVTFATGMIPHHAQAIEMADMAAKQASSAKVKNLSAAIQAAQVPEITTMSGWLTSWGAPVPDASHDMAGMDMGGMDMGGTMMSAADMTALGEASGKAFDTMWLQMMVKHHRGAVTMARTELAQGSNTEAKALVTSIITSQTKEITQMQALLAAG